MIPADVVNTVAAQEIEILRVIHVVEISAFRSGIDLVETDHALRRDQGAIEVALVQVVVLAQASGHDLFQFKSHALS